MLDYVDNLVRGLVSDFADIVIAELQRNGKNVLKDCFLVVEHRQFSELTGYRKADPPLLGVLLKDQKHIDQILACYFVELFHKLRKMGNRIEFNSIRWVF